MSHRLVDCLLAGTEVPASKHSTNLYDIYLMLCVQPWTPDDGRKYPPKHVQWYSINSKIVHLVCFIIEIRDYFAKIWIRQILVSSLIYTGMQAVNSCQLTNSGCHVLCPQFSTKLRCFWAEIAQRLASGWTVRRSNQSGGEIFRTRPDRPWSLPSLLYKGYLVFPGGKAAGPWPWPPTQSKAEVKERVELYLYSPSGSSWPVLGWTLPLPLPLPLLRCLQYPFRRSRFTYDKHAVNRAIPVGLSISLLFRKETSWGSSALRCVINLSGRESNELLLKKTFSAGEKRSAGTVWMWAE